MSVDLTNTYGHTPLHVSAKCSNLEAMKTFVERGADFNNANENGGTAQLQTAIKNTTEAFRYLTQVGADINMRNVYSNTALRNAVYSGSVKVIKIMKSVDL